MVKKVRAGMLKEAGYDDVVVEPRTNIRRDQRRADIAYNDRSGFIHVHYYTDDCVAHPLSETHIGCVDHDFDPSSAGCATTPPRLLRWGYDKGTVKCLNVRLGF